MTDQSEPSKPKKPRPVRRLLKQPVNRKVVYALLPVVVAGVFFWGWRSLAVVGVSVLTCFAVEAAFTWPKKQAVSEAALTTGTILGLILPPTMPFLMVILGAGFGIVFGKMVFGGFGRNIFNPAMTGRCFLYVCFPLMMTGAVWYDSFFELDNAAGSFPGGFVRWSRAYPEDTPGREIVLREIGFFGKVQPNIDGITEASPLAATFGPKDYLPMAFGDRAGSIGEVFTVLIALSGAYLLITRTADYRLTFGFLLGILGSATLFWAIGQAKPDLVVGGKDSILSKGFPTPFNPIFGGATMFVAVFMITDPISGAKTPAGKWIYAALVGVLTILIRTFSIWTAGAMFATLIGNMFVSLIDYSVTSLKARKKAKASLTPST